MLSGVTGPTFAPSLDIGRDVPGLAPSTGVTGGVAAPSIRTTPLSPDFTTVLGQMAMDAIDKVKAGESTAVAGIRGQATTQQVVEAVMASEQTLQAGIAIRDKVVSAYLEISRMTI
jgi:flagellar hook-basal body complex protein FliE